MAVMQAPPGLRAAFPPGCRVAALTGLPRQLMEFEEYQQWAAAPHPTSMPPFPFSLVAPRQAPQAECEDQYCSQVTVSQLGAKPPADSDDDGKATGAGLSTTATSSDDEHESWPSESCNEEVVPHEGGGREPPVTTLLIRHLPSLSTQSQLMQLWQPQHLEMDFLFVPYSAKQHRCCRYAFVNFSTAAAAQTFRERWASQTLPGTSPEKAQPLSIITSRVQGLQANIDFHWKVGSHVKSRQPAIFAKGKRVDLKHVLQNGASTSC